METKFVVIFTTCSSKKEAGAIVDALLKKRLVACANMISGVQSKFWWKGKIDNASECLVIFKAKKQNYNKIEKEIRRHHSYDVPEIIALPIIEGNKQYLDWIADID